MCDTLHFSWETEVLAFFLCSPREGPGRHSPILKSRLHHREKAKDGVSDDGHSDGAGGWHGGPVSLSAHCFQTTDGNTDGRCPWATGGGRERTSTSLPGDGYTHEQQSLQTFLLLCNLSLMSYFEPIEISSPPALLPWALGAVLPNSPYPGTSPERPREVRHWPPEAVPT